MKQQLGPIINSCVNKGHFAALRYILLNTKNSDTMPYDSILGIVNDLIIESEAQNKITYDIIKKEVVYTEFLHQTSWCKNPVVIVMFQERPYPSQ